MSELLIFRSDLARLGRALLERYRATLAKGIKSVCFSRIGATFVVILNSEFFMLNWY